MSDKTRMRPAQRTRDGEVSVRQQQRVRRWRRDTFTNADDVRLDDRNNLHTVVLYDSEQPNEVHAMEILTEHVPRCVSHNVGPGYWNDIDSMDDSALCALISGRRVVHLSGASLLSREDRAEVLRDAMHRCHSFIIVSGKDVHLCTRARSIKSSHKTLHIVDHATWPFATGCAGWALKQISENYRRDDPDFGPTSPRSKRCEELDAISRIIS